MLNMLLLALSTGPRSKRDERHFSGAGTADARLAVLPSSVDGRTLRAREPLRQFAVSRFLFVRSRLRKARQQGVDVSCQRSVDDVTGVAQASQE